jgi:O-antigen/teichoic acid export membrane protein
MPSLLAALPALPSTLRARIAGSQLAARLLGGAAWGIAGAGAASGLNLLAMMLVARSLGREAYGGFTVLQTTLMMAGVFAGYGIGLTATRYAASLRHRDPRRLAAILCLTERAAVGFGAFALLILELTAAALATHALKAPALTHSLRLAAGAVLFSTLDGYYKSVLIGLEAMQPLAAGSIVAAAAGTPLLVLLAYLAGVPGSACGLVLVAVAQCAVSHHQARRCLARAGVPVHTGSVWGEWRVLRDSALPALLCGVLVTPTQWVCQAILAHSSGGYGELAVLGVAMQWFAVIAYVPNVAGRIVLPVLIERHGSGERAQATKVLKLAVLANLIVASPVAILLCAASPWVMQAYGSQFRDGWASLALVAPIAVLVVVAQPIGHMLVAGERMWLAAALNFMWATLYVVGATLLCNHGALGVIAAMGCAYVVYSVAAALCAQRAV